MLALRNRFAQAAVGAAGRSLTVATLLPLTVVSLDLARTLAAEASSSKKEPSKELLLLRQLRALPASQAPKAPANAYSLFVKRNYDDVAKHYVGPAKEKPRNVAVKLGQLWKNAPEATRKEYFGAAEELRAKYNAAVKAYQANITPTQAIVENRRRYLRRLLGKKAARPAQDPNRPKRPPTAYMLFVKSVRDGGDASQKKVIGTTIAGKSIGEIGKLLGTAWRSLNLTEKKRYADESAPALESYKKDVVAYNTRTKVVDRRKELSKDLRKAALGKVKAKPKRRAAGTRRPAAKKAKKVVKKKAVVKKAKKAVKKPVKKAVKKVAKKPVAKKTSTGKKPAPKKKLAVKKN